MAGCRPASPNPAGDAKHWPGIDYAFNTATAMITSTIATAMMIPASIATLRPGARMVHGDSDSPVLLANARNSAVLRDVSGYAESSAAAGKSVSRSDMGTTLADRGPGNGA